MHTHTHTRLHTHPRLKNHCNTWEVVGYSVWGQLLCWVTEPHGIENYQDTAQGLLNAE